MNIYTRKGDSGNTSLYGGERVSKHSDRIEAYGTVDELNSILGIALTQEPANRTKEILVRLQQELFILGADLATPAGSKTRIDRIQHKDIKHLESFIDELEDYLPPLKNFILPGGSRCGATLHLARTVCRRAERAAVTCTKTENHQISTESIIYLNRFSDLLFVLARYENHQSGAEETPWKGE
jgi:cob(I)alamin adenosyltransferase